MRTISLSSTTLVAAMLVAVGSIASPVAAQEPASAVLNALEVQQLAKSEEPGDHARLSGHFAALADRSTADARRHVAMSQAYAANRRAGLSATMRSHCTHLAELATESAGTLRELAAFHEALSAGQPATAPRGGARFESGAGAPGPTSQELDALAAKADTPADHRALEEYFLTLAKRYAADAKDDEAMASAFRGTRVRATSARFDRLAALARDAAMEATTAATMHKDLAGAAR